mmetsp:Transcript_4303/g.11132  ORF Transcript_4303/g.11132 Transcript_4303/m.11132 type:complete len:112 (+) Transcript_4303:171-506(+)
MPAATARAAAVAVVVLAVVLSACLQPCRAISQRQEELARQASRADPLQWIKGPDGFFYLSLMDGTKLGHNLPWATLNGEETGSLWVDPYGLNELKANEASRYFEGNRRKFK